MSNLSIKETSTGSIATVNGDMTLQENSNDGVFINSMYSGSSLQLKTQDTTDTLTKYQITSTIDQGNNNAYTTKSTGSLSSTKLGGIVNYVSWEPFIGFNSDYPESGLMRIIGAARIEGGLSSNVMVYAVNSTCVRLAVHDDVYTEIITTWKSLPSGTPTDCPN
jgi:hypothetical protein